LEVFVPLLSVCDKWPGAQYVYGFKKSSGKTGGLFLERHFVQQETAALKAGAGQDKYADIWGASVCQKMPGSDFDVAALLLGGEVHCGSHDLAHFSKEYMKAMIGLYRMHV